MKNIAIPRIHKEPIILRELTEKKRPKKNQVAIFLPLDCD